MLILGYSFVSLPVVKNMIFEEKYCKKYAFTFLDSNSLNIIIKLLRKIVIFHMQITIIKIRIQRLERSIRVVFKVC